MEELHEEEEELRKEERKVRLAFILTAVFILILLAGVSYLAVQSTIQKKSNTTIVKVIEPSISITPPPSPSPLLTTSPTSISTKVNNESTTADYYINLGAGSNQSTDWTDVFGAVTTADIGQYQNIKEVHFEAFINVPTANGTVSVRLFNKTDKHPVWNSEVTRNGTADTYQFISPQVSYDNGPKLYQVQMKTQFGIAANLTSSRIHIVTK